MMRYYSRNKILFKIPKHSFYVLSSWEKRRRSINETTTKGNIKYNNEDKLIKIIAIKIIGHYLLGIKMPLLTTEEMPTTEGLLMLVTSLGDWEDPVAVLEVVGGV